MPRDAAPATDDERLIQRLQAYEYRKQPADLTVVEAAQQLGDRRIVAAVPALIHAIELFDSKRRSPAPTTGVDTNSRDWATTPLTSFAVSVAALRKIGEPAVGPLLDRLAQIAGPDAKAFNQERYLLEQALLGILGKDRAIKAAHTKLEGLSGDARVAMQTVVTTLGWADIEG